MRSDWILCSNANVHACLEFFYFFVAIYHILWLHLWPWDSRTRHSKSAVSSQLCNSLCNVSKQCMFVRMMYVWCESCPASRLLPFFRAGKPRYGMDLLVNSCFKGLEHLNRSFILQPHFSLRSGCTDLGHCVNSHICWWTALTLQSGSTCTCCCCLTLIRMTSPRGWWGPKQTSCRCWWHRTKEWFHLTTLYNSGVGQEAQLRKNVSLHVDIGCKEKEGGGLVDY